MKYTNDRHSRTADEAKPASASPSAAGPPSHLVRKWLLLAAAVVGVAVGGYFVVPGW